RIHARQSVRFAPRGGSWRARNVEERHRFRLVRGIHEGPLFRQRERLRLEGIEQEGGLVGSGKPPARRATSGGDGQLYLLLYSPGGDDRTLCEGRSSLTRSNLAQRAG